MLLATCVENAIAGPACPCESASVVVLMCVVCSVFAKSSFPPHCKSTDVVIEHRHLSCSNTRTAHPFASASALMLPCAVQCLRHDGHPVLGIVHGGRPLLFVEHQRPESWLALCAGSFHAQPYLTGVLAARTAGGQGEIFAVLLIFGACSLGACRGSSLMCCRWTHIRFPLFTFSLVALPRLLSHI